MSNLKAFNFLFSVLCLCFYSSAKAQIAPSHIAAIWANDGGDKVLQHERRAVANPSRVRNSIWDGSVIRVFAARNEIVSFNLILEASERPAQGVSVSLRRLIGTGQAAAEVIESQPTQDSDGIFRWVDRPIELFFIRYLQILGLSSVSYSPDDERAIPQMLQLPYSGEGYHIPGTTWAQRPGADKFYPEIAVPLELVNEFDIDAGKNQSIWADIYVSRFAVPGLYRGQVTVSERGQSPRDIPVELTVRNFDLPDEPSSKTMVYLGFEDINRRFLNRPNYRAGSEGERLSQLVRNRYFQVAHRHKISLIDEDKGPSAWNYDRPRPDWISRLDGSLFSAEQGYDGPGLFTSNGIYSIGTYGHWSWRRDEEEESMHVHSDAWIRWFQRYFPNVEKFIYLIDESTDYEQMQQWAHWIKTNPGPGRQLKSFATFLSLVDAINHVPDLDISASLTLPAPRELLQSTLDRVRRESPEKSVYLYNARRPGTGSFATEDDGVALRELPWGQYKKGIDRWFFWESSYYRDYQGERGDVNVLEVAQTLGMNRASHELYGRVGTNYSNGDGVLLYPGTDMLFPQNSYGVRGPLVSLRLKHWRRGIQDIDYITLASRINPTRVAAIVNRMVPRVLWDLGVTDPLQPTWVRAGISWSVNPDDWENARRELADIIVGGRAGAND